MKIGKTGTFQLSRTRPQGKEQGLNVERQGPGQGLTSLVPTVL